MWCHIYRYPFQFSVHFIPVFRLVRKNCEKRLLASSCPSVRPSAYNNSTPTGQIFMKFDVWGFFENLLRKFKFHYVRTKLKCTYHDDESTFFIISHWFLKGRASGIKKKNTTSLLSVKMLLIERHVSAYSEAIIRFKNCYI